MEQSLFNNLIACDVVIDITRYLSFVDATTALLSTSSTMYHTLKTNHVLLKRILRIKNKSLNIPLYHFTRQFRCTIGEEAVHAPESQLFQPRIIRDLQSLKYMANSPVCDYNHFVNTLRHTNEPILIHEHRSWTESRFIVLLFLISHLYKAHDRRRHKLALAFSKRLAFSKGQCEFCPMEAERFLHSIV